MLTSIPASIVNQKISPLKTHNDSIWSILTLTSGREARDAAKAQLAAGLDPALEKSRRKLQAQINSGNTFELIACEYIEKRSAEGWSESTLSKANYYLDRCCQSNANRTPLGAMRAGSSLR